MMMTEVNNFYATITLIAVSLIDCVCVCAYELSLEKVLVAACILAHSGLHE